MTYRILDTVFPKLIVGHAQLERLWTGGRWTEGPAHFPAGRYVVFSDIPNDRVMRFDETSGHVSIFRSPSGYTNGHTRDREGRLVSCEHGRRAVSRTEHDGRIVMLAERFGGRRLNSPNDVVVKSDGSIWFTDPTYGIDADYEGHLAPSEIGACNVYRLDPASGTLTAVVTDCLRPNGLCFAPDETILYVSDTGASHIADHPATISAYCVAANGETVSPAATIATSDRGFFDGFRCDQHGNIWTSCGDGVRCYTPDGQHIGTIAVPELVSNVCFGGPKRNRLYITAQTSLYAIYLATNGPER
jgi:gluconolactonase